MRPDGQLHTASSGFLTSSWSPSMQREASFDDGASPVSPKCDFFLCATPSGQGALQGCCGLRWRYCKASRADGCRTTSLLSPRSLPVVSARRQKLFCRLLCRLRSFESLACGSTSPETTLSPVSSPHTPSWAQFHSHCGPTSHPLLHFFSSFGQSSWRAWWQWCLWTLWRANSPWW